MSETKKKAEAARLKQGARFNEMLWNNYLRNDDSFSRLGKFETKPTDAEWGERFFQVRAPDGHPIVFATPISKND